MALRRHEIQKIYLDIQASLGLLLSEAPKSEHKNLIRVSVELVNIKRNMIGTFDEIETEIKLP